MVRRHSACVRGSASLQREGRPEAGGGEGPQSWGPGGGKQVRVAVGLMTP